jgi:drug/metabolite transporter (DMT)-like permease
LKTTDNPGSAVAGAQSLPSSPTRGHLDLRAVALVLVLCLIWGGQQVIMKSVAADVAPVLQLAVRFAGAAVFFGTWVAVREGRRAFADGTLPSGVLLGLMFSLEFVLLGQALIHTTAAHTVVFLYTAPIFTALGVQFLPDERLGRLQWAGIGVAFLGIVAAFLRPGGRALGELLAGDFLALLGGAAWGLSNVVLRRGRVGGAATAKTVLYQVGVAGPVLYVFAAATGQTHFSATAPAILALLFQTLVISIASYLVWFWLLRRYLTSRLMLLTLLTPLFGVVSGVLVLGDPIELRFALGASLVLAGILIVNGELIRRRAE